MAKHDQMDRVVNLAKRRGLVFPSSEIYGGFRSTWDYGPLGVLLKRNVKDAWWRSMVQLRDDVVGLDAAILMAPKVWEASGHVATFTDPLVDCRNCKERFRADQLPESGACPNCGAKDSFTEARQFNLMFKTYVGPVEDDASVAYLRPETAQGIFVNFQNVQTTTRKKPPFGIAQIGKSFRNEITPGNFIFRTREFEQMEMEFFVPPDEARRWHEYWLAERSRWYIELGLRPDHLRLRAHGAEELSHYSSATSDIEYLFPPTRIGGKSRGGSENGDAGNGGAGNGAAGNWWELEGIANRGDFDLTQHASHSGEKLEYFDQASGERYVPHVIEPAAGTDRATLAFLVDAYDEEVVEREGTGKGESRTVLRLHPRLAPVKVAVLPLVNKDGQPELAQEVYRALRGLPAVGIAEYDEGGAIGRRYRRQDEIGTPWCVTIDHQSLEDRTATVRDRDSLAQDRVPIDELSELFAERMQQPWQTPKLAATGS